MKQIQILLAADLALLPTLAQNHDGLWFNRWSRLVEPYQSQHWTTLENTLLDLTEKQQLMTAISRLSTNAISK